eukprot:scaffold318836_cov33-Tisochrysis_lutea.AAC.2
MAWRSLRVAALLAIALGGAARKRGEETEPAERMQVELSATAQPADDPRMAEQLAGMAAEMSDALTDIMAALQHGSEAARNHAVERLVQLSVATAEAGREQARMFRSAVVVGGALPEIVAMLQSADPARQALAASAVYTLAIDDPSTDADNFHSLDICQSGAVAPLVSLLSVDIEDVQAIAIRALAQLAENPTCQQMIAAAGALAPLVKITTYGGDMPRLWAMAALDVLSVNNPLVHQASSASCVSPRRRFICAPAPPLISSAHPLHLLRRNCLLRAHPVCCKGFRTWVILCYESR